MAVLQRAPVVAEVPFDPTTPEGQEALLRELEALPSELLIRALERQGVPVVVG